MTHFKEFTILKAGDPFGLSVGDSEGNLNGNIISEIEADFGLGSAVRDPF